MESVGNRASKVLGTDIVALRLAVQRLSDSVKVDQASVLGIEVRSKDERGNFE